MEAMNVSEYRIETEEVRMYDPEGEGFVGGPWTRYDLVYEERGEKHAFPVGFVGEEDGVWQARPALVDEATFSSPERHAVEAEVRRWAHGHYQTRRG